VRQAFLIDLNTPGTRRQKIGTATLYAFFLPSMPSYTFEEFQDIFIPLQSNDIRPNQNVVPSVFQKIKNHKIKNSESLAHWLT